MGKKQDTFWDVLGEIFAILLILVYVALILNANFNFIPQGIFMNILEILRTYGSLILVAIVGIEAVSKRGFIFKLIFVLLIALIVVFMFFPETYAYFIGAFAQ
ncbi:MAG: hypothetical protein IJW26_00815 [Clostridia bacterium]|nr:hypothetical protein [Clostridia bacterium]